MQIKGAVVPNSAHDSMKRLGTIASATSHTWHHGWLYTCEASTVQIALATMTQLIGRAATKQNLTGEGFLALSSNALFIFIKVKIVLINCFKNLIFRFTQ